jgi:transposase
MVAKSCFVIDRQLLTPDLPCFRGIYKLHSGECLSDLKHIPGRKTDMLDFEWVAEVCLKNLISPSRIFCRDHRELRSLTRTRESLIKGRTKSKNKVNHVLEASCIKLFSVLSGVFGKSRKHIAEGFLSGM